MKLMRVSTWTSKLKTTRFRTIRLYHEKFVFRNKDAKEVFTSIWQHNYWGNQESLSGPGSTFEQTQNLVAEFPKLLSKFKIKSVFDAPCGDFHWMKQLTESSDLHYIGGDIVEGIISKNVSESSSANVEFKVFDITNDKFPNVDLWLSRAIFYHLSNKDIFLALNNFMQSSVKYILTTNCVTDSNHTNLDIDTGDWRSLNLFLPPFNFPTNPLWEIDDYSEPHPPMKLCLWHRDQLIELLPSLQNSIRS
jgi:hypothetical protein